MKTYLLANLQLHGFAAREIKTLNIHGTIPAENENQAAEQISSKVTHSHDMESLRNRYYLKETTGKYNQWFLEEIEPVNIQNLQKS